ncbi:MAG: hypothetical protein LBI95_01335 [Holosporales bacterium]|jgi:hypothetical protein|nr:hypothetical protein [Holosporales bacterium]
MKKPNLPKASFSTEPFVSGFSYVEKSNSCLLIGSSDEFENVFFEEVPEYLKLLCSISFKSEFPAITISARYKITEGGELQSMRYSLYDGSSVSMNGIVSEVSVEFLDFFQNFKNFPKSWKDALSESKILYTKHFPIQNVSKNIDNFIDESIPQSGIIHTKSNAHFFAGAHFQGIKFSDIQPYLFYVGTGVQAKEYISIISAKDTFQTGKVKLSPDIPKESLATLEDDICNGKIELNFDDLRYKSVVAIKETLTSDVFQILFRKEN